MSSASARELSIRYARPKRRPRSVSKVVVEIPVWLTQILSDQKTVDLPPV